MREQYGHHQDAGPDVFEVRSILNTSRSACSVCQLLSIDPKSCNGSCDGSAFDFARGCDDVGTDELARPASFRHRYRVLEDALALFIGAEHPFRRWQRTFMFGELAARLDPDGRQRVGVCLLDRVCE